MLLLLMKDWSTMLLRVSLPLILLVLNCISCASVDGAIEDTRVRYKSNADENYEEAQKAFAKKRYAASILFYEHILDRYPYSVHVPQAALGIADAHFEREEWKESADGYRFFVRYHSSHPKVEFALYRIAISEWNDMPKEAFESSPFWSKTVRTLFPVARPFEKDQSRVDFTIRAIQNYIDRYPQGNYFAEVSQKLNDVRSRRAQHELYVADYYAKRGRTEAVSKRLEYIIENYADTSVAKDAQERLSRIRK
jgi:outer membrane protein assembly factor BamD